HHGPGLPGLEARQELRVSRLRRRRPARRRPRRNPRRRDRRRDGRVGEKHRAESGPPSLLDLSLRLLRAEGAIDAGRDRWRLGQLPRQAVPPALMRALREEEGSALVEAAILIPVLILILYWSSAFTDVLVLKIKASEAARYALFETTVWKRPAQIDQEVRTRF